jgi:phosphate starvation-inducible PhoH-like protein
VRGNEVAVTGPAAEIVGRLCEELLTVLQQGQDLDEASIRRSIDMMRQNERPSRVLTDDIMRGAKGKPIRPKTAGQKHYVDAIRNNVITFGLGPAGTGKSWLAVAMAVHALQTKQVQRIILTRPAVEAGEKLGFLPGTLGEKIDPYLRPLFDALHDMIDAESIPRLMQSGVIEVAPLAFMRGRTLNDAFVILDEAQNTTPEQMKMFLTRLGFGSKMVITGDVTQNDLPNGQRSGLSIIREILGEVDDIAFMDLTAEDFSWMFETNVLASIQITQRVARHMVARRRGHLVFMTSIAAREVYRTASAYCATKHALSAMARSFRLELQEFGIKVSEIAPGMVDTDIRATSDHPVVIAAIQNRKFSPLSPVEVASAVLFALQSPPNLCPDLIELRPQGSL